MENQNSENEKVILKSGTYKLSFGTTKLNMLKTLKINSRFFYLLLNWVYGSCGNDCGKGEFQAKKGDFVKVKESFGDWDIYEEYWEADELREYKKARSHSGGSGKVVRVYKKKVDGIKRPINRYTVEFYGGEQCEFWGDDLRFDPNTFSDEKEDVKALQEMTGVELLRRRLDEDVKSGKYSQKEMEEIAKYYIPSGETQNIEGYGEYKSYMDQEGHEVEEDEISLGEMEELLAKRFGSESAERYTTQLKDLS